MLLGSQPRRVANNHEVILISFTSHRDGWFGEYSTGYVSRTSSFHVDMNSEEIARPQEEEGEEEEVEVD